MDSTAIYAEHRAKYNWNDPLNPVVQESIKEWCKAARRQGVNIPKSTGGWTSDLLDYYALVRGKAEGDIKENVYWCGSSEARPFVGEPVFKCPICPFTLSPVAKQRQPTSVHCWNCFGLDSDPYKMEFTFNNRIKYIKNIDPVSYMPYLKYTLSHCNNKPKDNAIEKKQDIYYINLKRHSSTGNVEGAERAYVELMSIEAENMNLTPTESKLEYLIDAYIYFFKTNVKAVDKAQVAVVANKDKWNISDLNRMVTIYKQYI